MLYLGKELERLPHQSSNTPDILSTTIKPGLVSLPIRQCQARKRDDPEPVRPAPQWQFIYPVRRVEEAARVGVASHRIQLVRRRVIRYPKICSPFPKGRPYRPHTGRRTHVQAPGVHVVHSRHSWLRSFVQHRGLLHGARPTRAKPAHHIQELSHLPVPGQQERTWRPRTSRPRVGCYVIYLHRVAEGTGPASYEHLPIERSRG